MRGLRLIVRSVYSGIRSLHLVDHDVLVVVHNLRLAPIGQRQQASRNRVARLHRHRHEGRLVRPQNDAGRQRDLMRKQRLLRLRSLLSDGPNRAGGLLHRERGPLELFVDVG